MKYILIIIFLIPAICSEGQLSTNQFKQVTAMIKTASDNLYKEINWLKGQRVNDLARIVFLENLMAQQELGFAKLLESKLQQDKINISLIDSISALKKLIPDNIKVDTSGFLRVYNNILFSKDNIK